jgi:hypothetical protein
VAGAWVCPGVREVVVAWDVWARTCRWPSLIKDRRVLQWDFRRLVADVGRSFAGQRLVLVANRA